MPKKTAVKKAAPAATSPINFRMPQALRARLRAFAAQRHLGESQALRLLLSERLQEIDDERDLAAAERWQLKQALATWERLERGEIEARPMDDFDALLDDLRKRAEQALRSRAHG